MKDIIKKIIESNLPEKLEYSEVSLGGDKQSIKYKNHKELGFNQALSQINPSLIADEVLKVVVEKIQENNDIYIKKGIGDENKPYDWHGYNHASKDIINLLTNSSTLEGEQSPNKENENNE